MEHLVKYLSAWCPKRRHVVTHLLDVDATNSSTDDGIAAILHSLKKMGVKGGADDRFRIRGSSSDSGGAMTLEQLGNGLIAANVTTPNKNLLIAGCTIHTVQLQLSNPMKTLIGEGSLKKKNCQQLVYSLYSLQESLSKREWWKCVDLGVAMATKRVTDGPPPIRPLQEMIDEKNEKRKQTMKKKYKPLNPDTFFDKHHFDRKLETVMRFKDFSLPKISPFNDFKYYKGDVDWIMEEDEDGNEKASRRKIPKSVLTRWGTVGEASYVTKRCFLPIFCTLQTIINVHGTKMPGKIAADMMPLMTEPEIYSDLVLVVCYHEAYFNKELAWLTACSDLTKPGFQAHNMAVRYFIQHDMLKSFMKTEFDHPAFGDFRKTFTVPGVDKELQKSKMRRFFASAYDSLNKHWIRWLMEDLLPAALMSELPLAKCVARVILRIPTKSQAQLRTFNSTVHQRHIKLQDFESWLNDKVTPIFGNKTPAQLFPRAITTAAEAVLDCGSDEAKKARIRLNEVLATNNDHDCLTVMIARTASKLADDIYECGMCLEDGTAGVNYLRKIDQMGDASSLQDYMWSNYLPLMTQTQLVERGVKDTANVAKTGRGEQHRLALAIIRSVAVHTQNQSTEEPHVMARHLIQSADKLFNHHIKLAKDPSYKERFKDVRNRIRGDDHFEHIRTDQRLQDVDVLGSVLRKELTAQKTSGVDRTGESLHLIKYKTVRKGDATNNFGHQAELQKELLK